MSSLIPVKDSPLLLIDQLELKLNATATAQVCIPPLLPPEVSSNFCPEKPATSELEFKIRAPSVDDLSNLLIEDSLSYIVVECTSALLPAVTPVEDFTFWLQEYLGYPEVEEIPVGFDFPETNGKSYQQDQVVRKQLPLFEDQKRCEHGLVAGWCAICSKRNRDRHSAHNSFDLFDLILPILQPPLDDSFSTPIDFPFELYPFQREGIKFLIEHDRALLGDEMGLGKSIQAIVAVRVLFRKGKIAKCLLLCPKSVLSDWEKKINDWASELRVVKIQGSREERDVFWQSPAHIYLTNYEILREDYPAQRKEQGGAIQNYDLVILDEIQRIKNPESAVSKTVRKIDAKKRWGLSGTPLENRIDELFAIINYLVPGLFKYEYLSLEDVKNRIKPYFLRRRKADVLNDLPEKVREEVWLELLPAQQKTYQKAEQDGIVALNARGDSVTVHHILALITKLKQICNIDVVTKESCKLDYLLDELELISERGDKALVFSQYPEKTLRVLAPKMNRFAPLIYDGSLSDKKRQVLIDKFQSSDINKVLLMSVKAGGVGLTLTRANYVFHYDLWWNPAVAAQAEDRAHRIGQQKTVFVRYLYTRNTIEERIQNLLRKKRQLFNDVIDDLSETKISEVLTEEEIFGLFGLKKHAHSKKTP